MYCTGNPAARLFKSIIFFLLGLVNILIFPVIAGNCRHQGAGHHLLQSFKHMCNIFYVEFYCPGRVVDILEASGAFDPGSNPGRGVSLEGSTLYSLIKFHKKKLHGSRSSGWPHPCLESGERRSEILTDLSLSFTAQLLIPDNKIHCSPPPSRDIRGVSHAV